jgi:hypothetical protein
MRNGVGAALVAVALGVAVLAMIRGQYGIAALLLAVAALRAFTIYRGLHSGRVSKPSPPVLGGIGSPEKPKEPQEPSAGNGA